MFANQTKALATRGRKNHGRKQPIMHVNDLRCFANRMNASSDDFNIDQFILHLMTFDKCRNTQCSKNDKKAELCTTCLGRTHLFDLACKMGYAAMVILKPILFDELYSILGNRPTLTIHVIVGYIQALRFAENLFNPDFKMNHYNDKWHEANYEKRAKAQEMWNETRLEYDDHVAAFENHSALYTFTDWLQGIERRIIQATVIVELLNGRLSGSDWKKVAMDRFQQLATITLCELRVERCHRDNLEAYQAEANEWNHVMMVKAKQRAAAEKKRERRKRSEERRKARNREHQLREDLAEAPTGEVEEGSTTSSSSSEEEEEEEEVVVHPDEDDEEESETEFVPDFIPPTQSLEERAQEEPTKAPVAVLSKLAGEDLFKLEELMTQMSIQSQAPIYAEMEGETVDRQFEAVVLKVEETGDGEEEITVVV